ncbi:type II toxin-antitoxin system HipA family toxin [Limnohabitans sp. 2KL-3]|uniref:type II toxin-antitoxin system HipA family toxin n=1 Tax=Limnohabitans sp. 2KL-3 TaxID=1100700 RepID=UPI000A98C05B|nr:type II toxin-antitoxin system HipA family toxin [Limnohabitans sp. 2KL-3]
MPLSVYVLSREVATLEPSGDFKSVLSYHPGVATDDFVSLTMPVRTESYVWDDQLPPVLQMNLPEGYLLQVLQEQFGPHIGASPAALLSVIGRNMVGRLQVAAPGATLREPAKPIEVTALLKGDNSEAAFAALVREHATSGVSGVVPKFLDAQTEEAQSLGCNPKASLITRRHIVKGSSARLPFVALNEHLCMQVARRIMPTAHTQVSDDGQALVVHRFDVDEQGQPHWGTEDFCSLLGLRPAAKYDTTWERIAKAVRDHVPGPQRLGTFRQLANTLLLTYALRNADCHAKNLALLYTSRADVHLSPTYDMLTTSVYAGFQHNPPGIGFMGKKTWLPGKNLQKFIAANFGIQPKEQQHMVQAISDAVADVGREVRQAMAEHPGFEDIGKRMLLAWTEGVQGLRDQRVYAVGDWVAGEAFEGFSAPPKLAAETNKIGRSPLLGER